METSKVIEIKVGNYARVKNFNYVGKIVDVDDDKVTLEFETSTGEGWCKTTYLRSGVENLFEDDRFSECSMDFTGKLVIYEGNLYKVGSQVNNPDRTSDLALVRFRGNETEVHCDISSIFEVIPGTILRRRCGNLVVVVESNRESISFTENLMSTRPKIETYDHVSAIKTLSATSIDDEDVREYMEYFLTGTGTTPVLDQRIGRCDVGLKKQNRKKDLLKKAKDAAIYVGLGLVAVAFWSYESKRLYKIFSQK